MQVTKCIFYVSMQRVQFTIIQSFPDGYIFFDDINAYYNASENKKVNVNCSESLAVLKVFSCKVAR